MGKTAGAAYAAAHARHTLDEVAFRLADLRFEQRRIALLDAVARQRVVL